MNKYRDFFSIDENYFPSVNEELLREGLVDWTKYFPHETFVKLLKNIESVLSRNQKLNIWVEGAYGTGKSHAALTLKKLLDASDEETRSYFEKYSLDKDLLNKIQGAKTQGQILSIHRYGSSGIYDDNDLIIAVQESIKKALIERNIKFHCEETLKGAIINWLSQDLNKEYFNKQIEQNYKTLFGSDNVDDILNKLKTYDDRDNVGLIHNIFKVAKDVGINVKLDIPGLKQWIKNVLKANELKYIVFIWDEFNDYFDNNKHQLTGFQDLLELSGTEPFCFVIVTHKSEGTFHDKDDNKIKILGRFIRPTCNIELPENIAFKLIGAALEKKPDVNVRQEWNVCANDLNDRLNDSRSLVMRSAGISEIELKDILPIHPYTALMLKHLSSAFESNQRSMFDFIKNNRGNEVKAFQWYIDNYGPYDTWGLLTIDMLWDFFYENGKENLDPRIRMILDSFNRQRTYELDDDHQRVLKTILLLQAISQKVGDSVELFIPNDKNIDNAYDGTSLELGAASRIAEQLAREEVIYKKPMGNNKFQYSAMVNAGDSAAIERIKTDLSQLKKTQDLVTDGNLLEVINLSGALRLRYVIRAAAVDNLKRTVNELRNLESRYENSILAVVTFSKDEGERSALIKIIQEVKESDPEIVFIDTSLTPLGPDGFDQYINNLANSSYQRGKDNGLSNQFDNMAQDVLKKWKDRIASGEILVFTKGNSNGERFFDISGVHNKLKEINRSKFSMGIENYNVISSMFDCNSLASGALCGATQTVSGTYRSANDATKLENALANAWNVEKYWEINKGVLISKIKTDLENEIEESFKQEGRISIARLYDKLRSAPYGFMPCNLSAFIFGFLLKEYAVETYTYSDGTTSEPMSPKKLKDMIDEVIKLQMGLNKNSYKNKYIVKMSEEDKAFRELTAKVFNIPESQCASIENTRDKLRTQMKGLIYPIWGVKEIINDGDLSVNRNIIESIIDAFCGVANSANTSTNKSETDIALEIGKAYLINPSVLKDLSKLVTKENCKKGMIAYLNKFQNGELKKLADSIGDNSEYINVLKSKFDADAAAWVWRHETVEKKIQEVILEYKLIAESNKIIAKTTSFSGMIHEWCDKLNFYKLAYETIKNDIDDYQPLFEILVSVKRAGTIVDSLKEPLLVQLKAKSDNFSDFWNKQLELFKKKCSFQLNDLSDDQINEVFKKIPHGIFTRTNAEYMQLVGEIIDGFKRDLGRTKLRELWYEKTGTRTPRDWSTTYKTPILCMVDSDFEKAKRAFDTINRNNPDEDDIKKALDYLQSSSLFTNLINIEMRDRCFIEKIIKNYSVLLNDISDVRKVLSERLYCDVYDWYPNADTEQIIKKYAEVKYNAGGCDVALQRIENMEPNKLKTYLKQLIRENMTVGMEIISDK